MAFQATELLKVRKMTEVRPCVLDGGDLDRLPPAFLIHVAEGARRRDRREGVGARLVPFGARRRRGRGVEERETLADVAELRLDPGAASPSHRRHRGRTELDVDADPFEVPFQTGSLDGA